MIIEMKCCVGYHSNKTSCLGDIFHWQYKLHLAFGVGWRPKILAQIVQKVDNAIHQINLYPVDISIVFLILIHWIEIYPMDSAIQLLNNWGPKC